MSNHVPVPEQIMKAYDQIAEIARYRPMAPSDGAGNIFMPLEELDRDAEAREYAVQWTAEEDAGEFYIGCCDYSTRAATIYVVEAARLLCCGQPAKAHRLVMMAADTLRPHAGAGPA